MASVAELESRVLSLETKVSGAITLPTVAIEVNDSKISDKTGFKVFGIIAGIHSGKYFEGISSVATPVTDSDISRFIYKAI